MATQDIVIRLKVQGQRQFDSAMVSSTKSVKGVGAASEKTSKKVGGAIKGWVAGAAAAYSAQKVAGDAVRNAVDLGEEVNKTAVVFRASGDEMLRWSRNSATAMGMSRQQALAAAGTFGNMLVPMGFARGKAADMSRSMVSLAGDMASFNNASPEETLDALRSGLAGETEPLRRFGVFLNDARVKAEAASMGLVKAHGDTAKLKNAQAAAAIAQRKYNKAVGEYGGDSLQAKQALLAMRRSQDAVKKATQGTVPQLTAAQKAQATYSLIMKDSKDAQGDFARTSDSLANRQRILKAQYADITAQIGQKLIPVITFLLNNLRWIVPLLGTLIGLWAAYKAAMAIATAAQVLFNVAMSAMPIFAVITAVIALGAAFVIAYKKVGWFRHAVDAVWGWIKKHWPLLLAILTGPIGAAVIVIVRNFGKIKRIAGNAAHWIADRFRELINFFRRLPGAILGAISGLGKKIGDALNPGNAAGGVLNVGKKLLHRGQHGGVVPGGGSLTLVGEAGPELLALPGGSRVSPVIQGGATTAHFYLDGRLVASAVAQADANKRARR